MALSNTEMYAILNETYESMGYADPGTNFINDNTISQVGVSSPELRGEFIDQIMLVLNQRFWRGIFTPGDNFARAFSIDLGTNGWGMLETFQQFLDAATPMWDASKTPADVASDLVEPVSQKLSRKYYDSPLSAQFKNTINRKDTAKIFTADGMTEFFNNATAIMAASAEYFLMVEIMKEIKHAKDSNDFVLYDNEYHLSDKDSIDDFLATVRGVARDMELPSKIYNAESVLNSSVGSRTYILTNHVVDEYVNVKGRSSAFNLSLTDYGISTLYAPYENELFTDTLAIVLDRRAVILGIRTYMMTNFYVKNALYENFWMSVEGIKGHNRFFSAVVFVGTVSGHSTVIIHNATADIELVKNTTDNGSYISKNTSTIVRGIKNQYLLVNASADCKLAFFKNGSLVSESTFADGEEEYVSLEDNYDYIVIV